MPIAILPGASLRNRLGAEGWGITGVVGGMHLHPVTGLMGLWRRGLYGLGQEGPAVIAQYQAEAADSYLNSPAYLAAEAADAGLTVTQLGTPASNALSELETYCAQNALNVSEFGDQPDTTTCDGSNVQQSYIDQANAIVPVVTSNPVASTVAGPTTQQPVASTRFPSRHLTDTTTNPITYVLGSNRNTSGSINAPIRTSTLPIPPQSPTPSTPTPVECAQFEMSCPVGYVMERDANGCPIAACVTNPATTNTTVSTQGTSTTTEPSNCFSPIDNLFSSVIDCISIGNFSIGVWTLGALIGGIVVVGMMSMGGHERRR